MPQQCSILVVDDEPTVLRMVKMILSVVNCRVKAVPRAEDAAEILRKEEVDLLITDQNLPGIQGSELIKLARRSGPIPAILISGSDPPNPVEADLFVPKPFDPDALLKAVRELLPDKL